MDAASWDRRLAKWDRKDGKQMPLELVVLGVCGEGAELIDAMSDDNYQVLMEAGDLLWYVRTCCRRLHISFPRLFMLAQQTYTSDCGTQNEEADVMLQMTGRFADVVKKHAWHGKPVNKAAWIGLLLPIVCRTLAISDASGGWTHERIFKANHDKLRARYPKGFVEGGGVR